MDHPLNVPETSLPRVVIAGGGFGGLQLARKLINKPVQVVLLDRNNFHQFQPLYYQVAMSGLEPSSIVFPFRKIFHKAKNVHFRMTQITEVLQQKNLLKTSHGELAYDHLVLALGADTNYFGNESIAQHALPMKSVSEALFLRNVILETLESRSVASTTQKLNIIVVGGGPTGVEIGGMLAEMKHTVFPKDYPEIDFSAMDIHLVQAMDRVLNTFSEVSSTRAKNYLEKLGVVVHLNTMVTGASSHILHTKQGDMPFDLLIWAAGIKANVLPGIPSSVIGAGSRIKTNTHLQVEGFENIYALGDQGLVVGDAAYPQGHPQVAQTAIQGATYLAKKITKNLQTPFTYKDLGIMATVGRNLAVVELKAGKFGGWFAWMTWMFVHLMSIVGVKNRLFIFINWLWNYITYDQSLRLLIKPFSKTKAPNQPPTPNNTP